MNYFWYNLLFRLFLPFAFMRLKKRAKTTPAYGENWPERKGVVPFKCDDCIWIHAVSLGESIAAEPLITQILKDHPNTPILITNTTPSGREYIKNKFGEQVHQCYFPYDLPAFWNRFYEKVKPKLLLLIETELWPNCLKFTHEKKIPTLLVNARLSHRSMIRYSRFPKVAKDMLEHLDLIIAQNNDDAKRFVQLGMDSKKIKVTGSIKFDLKAPEGIEEKAALLKAQLGDRPIWIAASTHDGEEKYILDVHQHVLQSIPNALLILVPRHRERFKQVAELCKEDHFQIVTRSSGEPCTPQTQIFLGDTMGEMMLFYQCADLAFVGGSFVATGGHNLLEPAALKKPGLTGPYYFNFELITSGLIKAGGVKLTETPSDLTKAVVQLLQNPERRAKMGEAGHGVVLANRGTLGRQYALIEEYL